MWKTWYSSDRNVSRSSNLGMMAPKFSIQTICIQNFNENLRMKKRSDIPNHKMKNANLFYRTCQLLVLFGYQNCIVE